jgi:hypothetical protein
MMKIRMKIADKDLLLSVAQYEAILEVLLNADELRDKYVGSGKGENGTNYVRIIKPLDVAEDVNIRTMPDGEYEALVLKCKLNPELLT